jgi:hypothetical protein
VYDAHLPVTRDYQGHDNEEKRMPRAGVTKDEVIAAVSALRAQGRPISTRLLRLTIGRGSYKTISRYLCELGAKSPEKGEKTPDMPETLRVQFATLASDMWQSINKELSATTARLEAQCEVRVHVLTEKLLQERKVHRQIDVDLCTTQTQLSASNLRATRAEQELALLRERLSVEQALLSRSERERASLIAHLASGKRPPHQPRKLNGTAQDIAVRRDATDMKSGRPRRQH